MHLDRIFSSVTEGLYLAWPELRGCFLLLGNTVAKLHPSWFICCEGGCVCAHVSHFILEAYQSGHLHCSHFCSLPHFCISCLCRMFPLSCTEVVTQLFLTTETQSSMHLLCKQNSQECKATGTMKNTTG